MTDMQLDERFTRSVQSAEDRKRPRANPYHERDAQASEPGGDRNRDQSGSGDIQLEDHAVQASAQGESYNVTLRQELRVPMGHCQTADWT